MKLNGSTGGKYAAGGAKRLRRRRRTRNLLIVVIILILLYLIAAFSNIKPIAKWRTIYIQTAMSTMSHQWLATAFFPQGVIDKAMAGVDEGMEHQAGIISNWFGNGSFLHAVGDEEAFYETFWEIDPASMQAYLARHPEALDDGWENLYINEAAVDKDGTDIQTIFGEQVLAIDAKNQIVLIRVTGSTYRGVLAIAKDPSRLFIQESAMLGSYGQYAGELCEAGDGVLAMTANGFIDNDGVGTGGILAGYTMCGGRSYGDHMGYGYKRLELRKNNLMYIVDAQSSVDPATTDAVEFTPALIVDGEILVDENCGWTSLNPRACIGQSDKYEIMMLVVEGRLANSLGCSVVDCAEIMARHNCMQALNIDGGTSAILYYDGDYVTRCSNTSLPYGRTLPNAWVYGRSGE